MQLWQAALALNPLLSVFELALICVAFNSSFQRCVDVNAGFRVELRIRKWSSVTTVD